MARPINNPFNYDELLEKRNSLFILYQEAEISLGLLDVNSEFNFGKHKGKNITEVLLLEPSYVEWLIDSTDDKCFDFGDTAFENCFINQQHYQLNAIKVEIFRLQQNNRKLNSKIIPEYYKNIVNQP